MNVLPDFSFIVFIVAWFSAFFVPGDLLLRPFLLSVFQRLVLGSVVGMVLWSLFGLLFGFLDIRWFSYLYVPAAFAAWVKLNNVFRFKLKNIHLLKVDFVDLGLIFGVIVLNLSAVWFIGVRDASGGMFFCCRGVPDAIYHLSLTNQVLHRFPPYEPGMSGALVKNYHFLSNLVVADVARVFRINIAPLQFRYFTLFVTLLLVGSAYVLSQLLGLKKTFARWLVLFLFGSGDILYILLWLRGKGFNFDVTILDDATKLLAGPPRAFSILIFFSGLCLMVFWIKRRDLYSGLLTAILMGSLIGFKVYTGIFALVGLSFLGLFFLVRREVKMILPVVGTIILAAAIYLPFNRGAGGLHFNGFWRFEDFMVHKDLVLSRFELARLIFLHEKKFIIVSLFEMLFIFLYFFFLFGTVNLGLLQSKKSLSLFPKEINIFLVSGLLVTLVIGSFFYQTTGGANTVQFIIGAFIIGGVYSALFCYHILGKIRFPIGIMLILLVVILTCARAIHEDITNFSSITKSEGFKLLPEEVAALSYLRDKTPKDSKILLSEWMSEEEIFLYVSFLGDRPMYLAGAGVLRDHGLDTKRNKAEVSAIINSNDYLDVYQKLKNNQINYIYLPVDMKLAAGDNTPLLEKVYSNEKIRILKFNNLKPPI